MTTADDPATMKALRLLEKARPLGLARVTGGWMGIAGKLDAQTGLALTARHYARIDYSGRHPRLKITRQGRTAIGIERQAPMAASPTTPRGPHA
ncbi:hypothetical protein [Aurantimonas phage AmM-1]|uniref:hypothetical protein n=1 Tax=Aurantimonas phage AmM-1 TaxID=1503929 RepID=UPI0005409F92|nr:hypothetical protein ACQ23_gp45 [Aurantimonas phage AmM-1]BAP94502.1 hypothetical protein [Aurantimonas phage AmM-1]